MKNNKIVLWGASRFAQKFIPLVQASGIEIRYCIDSYHYGFKINDVEVISSSDPRVHDLLTTPLSLLPIVKTAYQRGKRFLTCFITTKHSTMPDYCTRPRYLRDCR